MKKVEPFGDLIKTNDLDPSSIDTSEIQELSKLVPASGQIDMSQAEIFATKFLRGIDLCGELSTLASLMVARAKNEKQKAYNYAFLVESAEKKLKTDKLRVAFAELSEGYQTASEKLDKANAFARWVDSKLSSLNKAHYLCKKLLDLHAENRDASGWEGATPNVEDDNDGW